MADGCVDEGAAAISTQIQGNAATDGNSIATIDLTIISEALETCKKKSKAQNVENVSEVCMKDMGWSQAHTRLVIEKATDKGVIKEITFGGKPALRKGNQSSVVFRDKSSSSYSQTTGSDIYSELIDFKKFMFSEIANLRTATQDKAKGMDTTDTTVALINCLQDRITSLEKQLDEKQVIIEENTKIIGKLISNQTKGYGQRGVAVLPHNKGHGNLHDNQVLQRKNQSHENDVKMAPIIVGITGDQKTQPSTKNKRGKKKPDKQKENSAPQKNQVPEESQPTTENENENKETNENESNKESRENDEGKNKRLHVNNCW
eukprot:Seg2739.2 transcript_id=Seg2739.2/GoldUCD/mRNA.D3Y31 product="hypothetical protein" protein_id=Seg2739.2/GoldUCD/D3Y31